LAHNADFESIEDASFRGELEAQNLKAGARLIMERHGIADVDAFLATIQTTEAAG
jgi:5-methylthioribose kinase